MNDPKLTLRCEACEQADAKYTDDCDDSGDPYVLCLLCQQRLHARSLRPSEWYNLAKRHGCERVLLHDDFYDENGVATQPEEDVEAADKFPAPTLATVIDDAEQLLDYSITQWFLYPETIAAWSNHSKFDAINALFKRYKSTKTNNVRERILEVCAATLGESGSPLVEFAWHDYPVAVSLAPLAEASASCLQLQDGFSRVTHAISELEGHSRHRSIGCLGYFHSTLVLDWIEMHIFEPITETWGYIAAASRLDWPRVEHWLTMGRPLSLVALDGLAAILFPQSILLRKSSPRLYQLPARGLLTQTLSEYAKRDPAPRVQKRVDLLISNAAKLIAE